MYIHEVLHTRGKQREKSSTNIYEGFSCGFSLTAYKVFKVPTLVIQKPKVNPSLLNTIFFTLYRFSLSYLCKRKKVRGKSKRIEVKR
jgi:hypothetical protein